MRKVRQAHTTAPSSNACGKPGTTPAVLIVFSAMVYVPLCSGFEVCRLDATSLSRLNRCALQYGRKLMRGKACQKQVHIARTNTEVRDFWQLVPADRELRMRRLKWFQTLAKDPVKRSVLLAVLSGRAQIEHADTVSNDGVVANVQIPGYCISEPILSLLQKYCRNR